MQSSTLVYIFLAICFSAALVWFQYYFKARNLKINNWLALFRFLGVLGVFLLLINPKISKHTYTLEKSNLVVLADNSSSIKNLQGDTALTAIVDQLSSHTALLDRFNLHSYMFGRGLSQQQHTDTLRFFEANTNTGKALKSVQDIYRNTNSAIVLLSDGNQTLGNAYEFMGNSIEHPIFPVVIGDTTRYEDIRISQINKNRYGFLRNKFPMEIYVSYDGDRNINTILTITENGKNVFRKKLSFSKTDNSKVVRTNLEAKSIGIKKITATVAPLQNEKNKANNSRTVALEVIDEKTTIGIVSSMLHPDIGALKKAIESNEQRQVHLLPASGKTNSWETIDLFILYQPNYSFAKVFNHIKKSKKNTFIITGTKTDWNFLNSVQNVYKFQNGYPIQEVEPIKNLSFSKFDISNFNTDGFPPLSSNVSQITAALGKGMILGTKIRGIEIESPLLDVFEQNGIKTAFLFGEGVWKWRMQAYRNAQDFTNFDEFIEKTIRYLSSSKAQNRFMLEYDNIYQNSSDAVLTAVVFDEAFVFDANANIVLVVKGKKNNIDKEYPMLLKQFSYEADLSDLAAGEYTFTALEKKSGRKRTGSFTILEYDVEKQFLSSDRNKLQQLATNTNGELFYPLESQKLIDQLLNDKRFTPVQKRTEKIVPLVDIKWLLGIIISAFAMEWLLRKYNGLT